MLLCPWGFSRQEYWGGLPCLLQGISPPRDGTCTSCISCFDTRVITTSATWKPTRVLECKYFLQRESVFQRVHCSFPSTAFLFGGCSLSKSILRVSKSNSSICLSAAVQFLPYQGRACSSINLNPSYKWLPHALHFKQSGGFNNLKINPWVTH